VDKTKVWRDWHEGGFRRFGVTFGQGVRWAIGGFVAGLEHSLGRPFHRRKTGPPAGRKRKRRQMLFPRNSTGRKASSHEANVILGYIRVRFFLSPFVPGSFPGANGNR